MVIIDANILLYAYNASAAKFSAAREWLEAAFSGSELVGLSWTVVLAFIRIATNPRAHDQPLTIAEAKQIINGWLHRPNVRILNPGEQYWSILSNLLTTAQVRGDLIMDAHLAALAIEHGATLVTNDRDFTRFEGLRVIYPLAD